MNGLKASKWKEGETGDSTFDKFLVSWEEVSLMRMKRISIWKKSKVSKMLLNFLKAKPTKIKLVEIGYYMLVKS